MKLDDIKIRECIKRLLLARLRILNNNPFYGLLLMTTEFGIDENAGTAYTNGKKIVFDPKFMDELSNNELDFILMHEIMHIVFKHCKRQGKRDNELFNIACDIVVNSNILKSNNMDISSITLKSSGESMHLVDSEEGYKYTAEEVYELLLDPNNFKKILASNGINVTDLDGNNLTVDDHSNWQGISEDESDKIDEKIVSTVGVLMQGKNAGNIPAGIIRLYKDLVEPEVNWREVLKDFMTFDTFDYTFTPSDKRYDDFFLPDFNDIKETIRANLLIAVDTSGSIEIKSLTQVISEIKSIIDLSDNDIKGIVVPFDAKAYEPINLEDFDVENLKLKGGGGTNFNLIFNKLDEYEKFIDGNIDLILFFTDGYANFPKEESRRNIPTLWIIDNEDVTPPWGLVTRIRKES